MDHRQVVFILFFYLLVMTEGNSEISEPILGKFVVLVTLRDS